MEEKMELLTVEEVTALLHLKNRKTIDNWLYSGILPRELTLKIGRKLFFVKSKLDEFLKTSYAAQNGA